MFPKMHHLSTFFQDSFHFYLFFFIYYQFLFYFFYIRRIGSAVGKRFQDEALQRVLTKHCFKYELGLGMQLFKVGFSEIELGQ